MNEQRTCVCMYLGRQISTATFAWARANERHPADIYDTTCTVHQRVGAGVSNTCCSGDRIHVCFTVGVTSPRAFGRRRSRNTCTGTERLETTQDDSLQAVSAPLLYAHTHTATCACAK